MNWRTASVFMPLAMKHRPSMRRHWTSRAGSPAASLNSEFTIPEVVQTIILTRGAGNTPLPPHEDIAEMAKQRATMCIFLSATIAKRVQEQLLQHYPADTPVAILYRVSWDDEEIYTGQLTDLAAPTLLFHSGLTLARKSVQTNVVPLPSVRCTTIISASGSF